MAGGLQRESDKYNGSLQASSIPSSKSAYSQGYGLGFSSGVSPSGGLGMGGLESQGLSASFSPARSSMSDEILGSQESSTSTAYLEPFGGADKFYPPPSPLKPKAPSEVSTPSRRQAAFPILQISCLYMPLLLALSNRLATQACLRQVPGKHVTMWYA